MCLDHRDWEGARGHWVKRGWKEANPTACLGYNALEGCSPTGSPAVCPADTPRYAPQTPRGQVSPLHKESLTKLPCPADSPRAPPAGTARGGGTLLGWDGAWSETAGVQTPMVAASLGLFISLHRSACPFSIIYHCLE
jgi:hypothetical protein